MLPIDRDRKGVNDGFPFVQKTVGSNEQAAPAKEWTFFFLIRTTLALPVHQKLWNRYQPKQRKGQKFVYDGERIF